jgi:hypothetical protein
MRWQSATPDEDAPISGAASPAGPEIPGVADVDPHWKQPALLALANLCSLLGQALQAFEEARHHQLP